MSDYSEVIEERANYRVRIEHDDSPDQPYDEGACPILQIKAGGWNNEFNAFNTQANGFDEKYAELYGRTDDTMTVFERYLRIFHGCRSFVEGASENYSYIAFDTAAWREEHQMDEYLLMNPMEAPKVAEGSLTEVVAWADGEVFGYIVEKNVADRDEEPEWESVDDGTCWGFYGREYAEESAKAELELAIKHNH